MASWSHEEQLAEELRDTLEQQALRGRRLHPDAVRRRPGPKPAEDCPDCGAPKALRPLGFCEGCGLHWDDIVAAAEMHDRLLAAAQAEAALPSPRAASYPKRKVGP